VHGLNDLGAHDGALGHDALHAHEAAEVAAEEAAGGDVVAAEGTLEANLDLSFGAVELGVLGLGEVVHGVSERDDVGHRVGHHLSDELRVEGAEVGEVDDEPGGGGSLGRASGGGGGGDRLAGFVQGGGCGTRR